MGSRPVPACRLTRVPPANESPARKAGRSQGFVSGGAWWPTVTSVIVELRPLSDADVEQHCAGEDDLTVRRLTGAPGTIQATLAHFNQLAANAAAGAGKRGFGVWLDGRLAGYVDADPDNRDHLEVGDVNLSYAVHPWARGRGVAPAAVRLLCGYLRDQQIGTRAAIRVEPDNTASVRVAEKCEFSLAGTFASSTDTHRDGTPITFNLYLLEL